MSAALSEQPDTITRTWMQQHEIACVLSDSWESAANVFCNALRIEQRRDECNGRPLVHDAVPHQLIRADVTNLWDGPYKRCPLVVRSCPVTREFIEVMVTQVALEVIDDRQIATFEVEASE